MEEEIDQSEFESKLEVTLIEAEKWWEELEDEQKAELFLMKKDGES